MHLDLDRIRPNNDQPRRTFDQTTLEELAASMQADGVLQPVIVRPVGDNRYELIAGERRWRAAQLAGLLKVPALVREVEDNRVLEMALIENVQREDLNPLEAAAAYKSLIEDLGLTQQEVAERVGKQRATIANMVRLLDLPKGVRQRIREGEVSVGHGKLLASVPNRELQQKLADRIARDGLTVRALEKLLKRTIEPAPTTPARPVARDPNVVAAEESLQRALGTKVSVRQGKQGGSIELHFFSNEEMERIYSLLMKLAS